MNPALLILLPVILAIFLTGGISIKSPGGEGYGQPVTLSEGGLAGIFNTLQINSLVPGSNLTPVPTTPPGVTSTPVPTIHQSPTPTPRSGVTPTRTPTPTQGPSLCRGRKIAFDLLFDVSGSIGSLSTEMAKASRRLISLLDDETVVGIQEFSVTPREVVSFNKLRNNRTAAINLASSSTRDLTYMKNGFDFARGRINSAKNQFPGYKWYMVFFSDGVPNCTDYTRSPITNLPTSPCPSDPGGTGDDGPNREQDPTPTANTLNGESITIWSIGFHQLLRDNSELNLAALSPYGYPNTDGALRRYAVDLMQNRVASSAQFYREYGSGQSLESLYETIGRNACP